MVTETLENLEARAATIADRLTESARHAGRLMQDARDIKARATEAVEDGVAVARRAARRTRRDVEDLRDEVVVTVRRAPLAAVGVMFAAGLLAGLIAGRLSSRRDAA